MADFSGTVWVYEQDRGEWIEALRNRPLTSGDRISTGNDARAELRIGSTTIRLGGRTELEVQTLDDQRLSLRLLSGSVAMRVRSREWAEQVDLSTPEVRIKPLEAGHYRFDRLDDVSFAGAWRGELLVDEASSFPISAGQRIEFWRERGERRHRWSVLPVDALHSWAVAEDQREERTASTRYVSPEMTGAEDLDRHGRWERVPDHGAIWFPWQVSIGWAPYLFGNWVWVRPWGWVWVDSQPWGFATFHYGRWVQWRGQWGWVPGAYAPRPVFAPAPRPPHEGRPIPPPYRPGVPGPDVRPPHRPDRPLVHTPPPPWSSPSRDPEFRRDRDDRHDRFDQRDRPDRPDRPNRPDRVDGPPRDTGHGPDRGVGPGRPDDRGPDRGDRIDRPDRPDRIHGDRRDRGGPAAPAASPPAAVPPRGGAPVAAGAVGAQPAGPSLQGAPATPSGPPRVAEPPRREAPRADPPTIPREDARKRVPEPRVERGPDAGGRGPERDRERGQNR